MGFLWSLLGDSNDSILSKGNSGLNNVAKTFTATLREIMGIVMPIVLSVVLAFGVFFCVKLGIAYAKCEKTEDREEAKKRLVGAVIGFGIGIVAAAVMWILFTNQGVLNALFGA